MRFLVHMTSSMLVLFTALYSAAHASPAPTSYTLDFPVQANLATPIWLGHPTALPGTFASLDLPLSIPEAGASLLVTISFLEKEGGFLRISWKSATAGEQVLSNNFYQGVGGMENRRSILVPANLVGTDGTLRLQCGDSHLDVEKIQLQWLEDRTALISPDKAEKQAVPAVGETSDVSLLDGRPAGAISPSLDGSLVTVPLTSAPQRIEEGVEFNVQLDGAPRAARLSFQELGLPWDEHLVLWINQQRAGTITPSVPDLADSGFVAGQPYTGWRGASIYLPAALLKPGINALQLSVENDDDASTSPDRADPALPLAVDRLTCQFDYTPNAAPTGTPAPQVAAVTAAPSAPTAPVTPSPSATPDPQPQTAP